MSCTRILIGRFCTLLTYVLLCFSFWFLIFVVASIVDSQASIIDQLVTMDDASGESNVVRDILGISGTISTAENKYCMYPLLRITPGFVSETGMLHGHDTIISGIGDSFLIGDDIRGFSPFDL